jgi:hypothetical protein
VLLLWGVVFSGTNEVCPRCSFERLIDRFQVHGTNASEVEQVATALYRETREGTAARMKTDDTHEVDKTPSASRRGKSKPGKRGDGSSSQLAIFGRVGGFGGLVLFVFVTLFSRFADLKPIFGNLSPAQTYNLLLIFMVLVFIFAVFGLVCWVYVNNQKKESRSVRVGLLILMALIAFGIGAWATMNQTRENVAKSLTPDLESQNWNVNIRVSQFPPFEGRAEFRADHTFEATGRFLIPTGAQNEHIECPAALKGSWSYPKNNPVELSVQNMFISQFSDSGISKDQYQQCSRTLQPIASSNPPTWVSATCAFESETVCRARDLEMHFTPLK